MSRETSEGQPRPARPPLKQSALLALLAALNVLAMFGYQWLPVVTLGVGSTTDAFFFSAIVPQIVLSVVSSGLTSVLTPLLATAAPDAFRRKAWTFAHAVAIGAIGVNGLLFVTATIWVPALAAGFDHPTRALAIGLVRIQLISAVFTSMLTVNWSAYYARDRFVWVESSALIAACVGLAFLILTVNVLGVYSAAWALVVRAVLQVLLLTRGLGAYSRPEWRDDAGRTALRRLLPIVGGSIFYKADPLV